MSHYQQSLVLDAAPAAVYAALTTPAGLRGWWTPRLRRRDRSGRHASLPIRPAPEGDAHRAAGSRS